MPVLSFIYFPSLPIKKAVGYALRLAVTTAAAAAATAAAAVPHIFLCGSSNSSST
jgi:hypothetical protein